MNQSLLVLLPLLATANELALARPSPEPQEVQEVKTPPPPATQGILASAIACPRKSLDEGVAFSTALTALIWQAKQGGLEFAAIDQAANVSQHDIKTYVPDFAWRGGVKVDFGYYLPFDGWDLDSRWTYYRGEMTNLKKSFSSQNSPAPLGIIPLWFYSFIRNTSTNPLRFNDASQVWKLRFDTVDLELGRLFFEQSALPVRLLFGLKAAWTNQTFDASYSSQGAGLTYTQATIVQDNTSNNLTAQINGLTRHYDQGSWALGPRMGFSSNWEILWGVSVLADGAFSLLSSSFDSKTKITLSETVTAGSPNPVPLLSKAELRDDFHEVTPVIEAKLGIDSGVCLGQADQYFLHVTIAYEWQYWFNQNHARRSYSSFAPFNAWDVRGDLQLHGLAATVGFEF